MKGESTSTNMQYTVRHGEIKCDNVTKIGMVKRMLVVRSTKTTRKRQKESSITYEC